ncbi:MAG: ABC transporter permease [Chitinophagaceae bacterium]
MQRLDVLSLAFRTIRSNKLRTGITVAIIALGIMALVGIITAIEAMNQKLTESFSSMGANGFTIRYKARNIRMGGGGSELKMEKKGARKTRQSNLDKPITMDEAEAFMGRYQFPAVAGISTMAGRNTTASYEAEKTNPNVTLFGGDEQYLSLNGLEIQAGRNFTRQETGAGNSVCIIGLDVAKKLFNRRETKAINQVIRVNGQPFRVIGLLEERGASFGLSRDNIIIVPYKSIERYFASNNSYSIGVKADDLNQLPEAMGEAEGVFRGIRKLNTTEESNFVLDKSDSVAERAMNSIGFLTISVTIIGLITLIGAAIGLMNIMLVSVTERTKEVGLIKAIGGKSKTVRQQFLTEAVIISILGAIIGIVLGILVGNLFSMILDTGFVVPWLWIAYGIGICTLVGLLAGLYPALKAGKLNPIEALRYE